MTRAPASVVRRLRELAVVSVAALAVLAGLVTASEVQFRAVYGPERDRLLMADEGLDDLVAGMLDQETGVRGYLASGDRAFLEPYDSGRDQVLTGLAQLAAGLRDETGLAAFAAVQTHAAEWQQEYGAPTVALASRHLDAAATDGLFAQQGKEMFDAFRVEAERLDAHLQARLAEVNAQRDRVRVALLGGALVLLVALAAVGGRRVRTTRLLVERPVRLLTEHARAAHEGRHEPGPEDVPVEFVPVRDAVDGLVADLSAARHTVVDQQVQLVRAARVTSLLLEQTRLLAATSEAPAIAAATGEAALALLTGLRVAVWLEGAGEFRLAYESGWRGERHALALTLTDAAGCPAERARHFGRVIVDDEADVVAAPLIAEGRALGVVAVVLPPGRRPDGGDLDALQVLLSQGAGALTAARLLARTTELTLRDPLTGLANRRQLEHDLAELDRAGDPDVGLLVLDVDHFKTFNDTHGHAAGDDLLRALGDVLAAAVRTGDGGDSVYRYGGEEFVVLLRECRPETVVPSAERLRETVARRLVAQGVTVSVGAAAAGGTTRTTELFGAADAALYAAKAAGRNRVVLADAAPPDVPALVGGAA